jgi:hypothetical protein
MRYKFEVVCIEEDYFSPVKFGNIYTVADIIEEGSPEETYILEGTHPDGTPIFEGILAYSDLFVTLKEWREKQLKELGI